MPRHQRTGRSKSTAKRTVWNASRAIMAPPIVPKAIPAGGPSNRPARSPTTGIATALNYGLDRVRFVAAVVSGSRVRCRVKLVGVEAKGKGRVLITTETTVEIEGQDKPALIASSLVMAVAA